MEILILLWLWLSKWSVWDKLRDMVTLLTFYLESSFLAAPWSCLWKCTCSTTTLHLILRGKLRTWDHVDALEAMLLRALGCWSEGPVLPPGSWWHLDPSYCKWPCLGLDLMWCPWPVLALGTLEPGCAESALPFTGPVLCWILLKSQLALPMSEESSRPLLLTMGVYLIWEAH